MSNPRTDNTKAASAAQRRAQAKEWLRLRTRRFLYRLHIAASSTIALTPATYLAVAGALGVALTVTTMYSTSYAVMVDGEYIGRVADQQMVEDAIRTVETRGSRMLGTDFQVEGDVDYQFALTLKSDLNSQGDMEDYFYDQLDAVSTELRMYEVVVNGESMGIVKDGETLEMVLESIKRQYVNDNTISAEFVENLRIDPVYEADVVSTVAEVQERLAENTTGETTYTVVSGDTFNAIAHANDMAVSDLKALNPDVNINRLQVGDELTVKEYIPKLSVRTVEEQIYHQAIECPIVEVEDDTMYKGDTKVLVQGTEGDALINATVTYVNGREKERVIDSSSTLREPTTTTMAVGTKEKPKTASKGYYIWPASGRITSYFGGRNIFGSYSYHGGIDIKVSYGQSIKAADGGTVSFAGWKGTYGKLVIIKHDNGTLTYYAHNSSLLVSAGDKVYQGQVIAKGGSTGRSTGNHCHFEIRVNGTAVNPLNYLS